MKKEKRILTCTNGDVVCVDRHEAMTDFCTIIRQYLDRADELLEGVA